MSVAARCRGRLFDACCSQRIYFELAEPGVDRIALASAMAAPDPETRACAYSTPRRRAGRLACALPSPALPPPGPMRRKCSRVIWCPCERMRPGTMDRQAAIDCGGSRAGHNAGVLVFLGDLLHRLCRPHPELKSGHCTSGHCASGQLFLTWIPELDGWVPAPFGTAMPPAASVSQTGAAPFFTNAGGGKITA